MSNKIELQMIEQLSIENDALRKAGCKLAQRALYTISNYDGLHRLSLAVSHWANVLANENGRGEK